MLPMSITFTETVPPAKSVVRQERETAFPNVFPLAKDKAITAEIPVTDDKSLKALRSLINDAQEQGRKAGATTRVRVTYNGKDVQYNKEAFTVESLDPKVTSATVTFWTAYDEAGNIIKRTRTVKPAK